MADKYWWQKEQKKDSSQQTGNQQTGTTGTQGYWWQDLGKTVGSNIESRVNTWLKNHNTYISNYQTRNEGRTYTFADDYVSDPNDWLITVSKQKKNFDAEADSILAYMDRYKNYLDADWMKSVQETLTGARSQQQIVLDNSTADSQWWRNFANEDEYKTAQRYDGYSKKYSSQKYEDIQKALGILEDGEEKNWLSYNQYALYQKDGTYQSKATSGLKSFEAQKVVEQEKEADKAWWETIAENYAYSSADTSLPAANLSIVQAGYRNDTSYREPTDKWSDGEKMQFGYLYAEDPQKAYAYAEQLNNEYASYEKYLQQQGIQEAATKSGWSGVGHTLGAIATAPLGLADYLDDLAEYSARGTITQKSIVTPFEYSQAVQSGISNKLNEKYGTVNDDAFIIGGKGLGDIYSLGMSAANSMISAYTLGGTGTLVNFIGQGGAAGVDDALSRGATPEQAIWYGTIVGAAEGVTEMINADNLLKVGSSATLKNYLLKALNQGIGESIEEGASSVIGNVADAIIMQDKSSLNAAIENYMTEGGLSKEEATKKAWIDMVGGVIYDAMGGFATGSANAMTIGGASTAWDARKGNQKNIDALEQYGDKTADIIAKGQSFAEGTEARKLADKYQKQTQGKDGNEGKAMTGFQIRNLVSANDAQSTVEDAKARLTELGETKDVAKLAQLVAKQATGEELTRAEKSTLARSEYGAQVAKEITDTKKLWSALVQAAKENSAAHKSLTDRVGEESNLSVSESGQTMIRETGEAFDIKSAEVGTIVDGQMTFKVADGREVSAEDIDWADEGQAFLVSAISNIENITPGDATVLIHEYDASSEQSVAEYVNGIDEAYKYGNNNYSVEDMKAGKFTAKLTEQQMMSAYQLGKTTRSVSKTAKVDAIKRMRTAVDAEVEKLIAEGKTVSKGKMTITYNAGNGNVVDFDKAGVKLTTRQKAAPALANVMHEMGLGTNFELFSSYLSKTLTDENGKPVRVFLNDMGEEEIAYSGLYRMKDGTVRIDLNAYNGRGLTLDAMSHELTHFIQQWSDEKYEILADFLVKTYEKTNMSMHDRVLREQARLERIRKEPVSYNEAYNEVVANAMSKMLADGKVMERLQELKAKDMNLAEKLWEGLKKLLNKFFRIYEKEAALFYDAADLMELKAEFEQMQKMWADAFVEASDNFQASITAAEMETLNEAGIGFDEDTKSVHSLHFSNAYTEQIQVGKKSFDAEAIAQLVAKVTGRSITDARKWVKSEMAIANIVMQNPEFLDFEADNRYDAIKKNSDYPQGTVDLSNLCPKREEFTTMFDMLQKKYPNKLFTAQDVADMRKILSDNDITVACGACFVEDRRQLIGEIADTFIGMWKEAVDSGKPLQKTNAAGSKIDLLVTKALAKQYGLTAGTKIMATDTYIPNQYDLTTYEGFKKLEKNHPTIAMAFNRYNNSRGQQSARLIEGRAEYKRQILGWSDAKVRSVNNNGGLRIFSFSDFEVVHLLDLVQVIIDCSAKGIKIQGYTKIPAFAKLVRGTGIKLNRSLIPKGDYGYHMENGKVVLDYDTTEGINIHDKNFMDESDNPNVGNIVIGINSTQISAAMLDPFIDYIIPFHSNKAKEILRKLGTGEWVNYKESQHEKDISTGKASKRNVNIYTEVLGKYHPKNKVEFVEAFLKECKRQGKVPRYAEFLNVDANGDYTYREGYHKLLVDFKMFDKDGNILPQGNITPNLDEGFMKELLNAEIDKKQNYEFPKKVYDAIDKKFGEQYSSQETDADVVHEITAKDVVNSGNGVLAVNISSKKTGLNRVKKSKWASVISKQIRDTLQGHAIYAADGDIIRITDRAPGEVSYGTNSNKLFAEAKKTGDYSEFNKKMITADHAMTIIALSTYDSWSANEDLTDMFKRDGINHRKVNLVIDGEPHTAVVLTCLNIDSNQTKDYGEKFYDIVSIEKQAKHSAMSGTFSTKATPHKIRFADGSPDMLTITQRQRIVNRQDAKYSSGDSGTMTAMAEAFSRAKELKSSHETDNISNRSLLANAFEGISQNSVEYKMIQDYKSHVKELNELETKLSQLNAEIRKIRFGTEGVRDAQRMSELEDEAKKIAKEINRYDKRLLNMEASEPLRKVIVRERKKEAQKTRDHVQQIQQNKKVRAEQAELRHKIRKAVRDLDKILNRGNKKQNVKEDLQNVVTKALKAADILFTDNYGNYDMLRNGISADLSDAEEALVNTCTQMLKDLDKMPTDGYDNFTARQEAESRLKAKMSKLKDVFARERKRLNNTTVSSILGELADAYASLEKSDQSYVQGVYREAVHNFLKSLQSEVGGTIVKDMTKDQLESVYAAYKLVLTTVRNANKMFNEELKQNREQLGNAVIAEVIRAGGVHGLWSKAEIARSQASWNNTKPIWVANRIGSGTFGMLMNGLFKGQYNFAVDVEEAKQFKLSMDKKYKPRNWDAKKQYNFESSTGRKFSLNLQQIMSLYAFSKREQAYSHLLNGGFVFESNSEVVVDEKGIKRTYLHDGATSYKMNEATLNEIINSLTKEQKAYVDEMQKYLSEVMGARGNEVSMKLYGIKMFKEQFYFPLRSSGAYMERAKEAELKKQQGQINLVNSGFTHSVKPEAKNPIILSGFMDVWAEHCNEMSMYHSMVLPMEDFRKVYNYSTVHDDKFDSASVYQTIQDAYGKAATGYIDQLYRELNAGATVDPRETPFKARISKFKKAAVMLSASVVVQQFSAVGRSYALIDPKYFIGARVKSNTQMSVADEMKKYAPVAIIKEMGGFDTGTKGSAKNYIMAEQYGKGERIKGFMKDEQYRGDIMGFFPAKADEMTWCSIWEAVKRETKAKHPKMDVKSEQFLKLAGERFSVVIEKTQVYDSVLARSANMRSKSAFMAMATAFMAEPTTTINLLEDALRGRSAKNIARAFGAAAVSIILNNALASVVYAMRDDDEDETFIEKYFQSFASGMVDDINPMSYYPFLKDVYSLFQGYDVERADMSVIADLRDALKQTISVIGKDTSDMDEDELVAHWKKVNGVMMSLLDAGCSAFGVPFKNVRRDVNGVINAYQTISTDLSEERDNSWNSFWDKVGAAVKDTIPIYAWTKDESKQDNLYEVIMSGDKQYLARLKSGYKDDDAYASAVRKALRENDSRIYDAAQAKYDGNSTEYKRIFREIQKEGKFSFDDIMNAILSEESKIRNDQKPDGESSDYSATDFVNAMILGETSNAKAMREDIISAKVANGKTKEKAEESFADSVATSTRNAFDSGLLDEAGAEKMLLEYADMDEAEAAEKVSYWSFIKAHPQYRDDLSQSNVEKYYEFAEPAEIPLDVFVQYVDRTKGLGTIRDEYGEEVKSKKEQVIEVIDSLPLSWRQKDALYLSAGYAESGLVDVPW